MSALLFKDISVVLSLSTQADNSLADSPHLTLEFSSNENVIRSANLSSNESTPRIWDTDEVIGLVEIFEDFKVSAWAEDANNERQLVGFVELNGRKLYDDTESRYELPLKNHSNYPNLTLKAGVMKIEKYTEIAAALEEARTSPSYEEADVSEMLGDALAAYYDFALHGNMASLEQAILQYQTVVDLVSEEEPGLPAILNNLGSSLVMRFEQSGHLPDLNHAITQFQAAVDRTPEKHSDRADYLTNLGNALAIRFQRLGNLADLDDAISRQQEGVGLLLDDHTEKPNHLSNLGSSLSIRFDRLGNLADIDDAIARQQAAINLATDVHPNQPIYLRNLGKSLATRFQRLGSLPDINQAIARQQAAVDLTLDDSPDKPSRLSSLGISLSIRFDRLGDLEDINRAIVSQQTAVELTTDESPSKPGYLAALGTSLTLRFKKVKKVVDIDHAIERQQAAVDLTPDGDPNKPNRLNSLGTSLSLRFQHTKHLTDIDKGISTHQEAVSLIPDGHPDRTSHLNSLGFSLQARFHYTKTPKDAEAAISCLSSAATTSYGPPTTRFLAATAWIVISSLVNHKSLLEAYECALSLMPLVAWLGLSIPDRHQHLMNMGGIARDAAAAAISFGEYNKALEWLEQGRAIVWNQILQLRTPVDRLRDVDSDLADQLLQASRQLDHGAVDYELYNGKPPSIEEEGRRYRVLTAKWESIIQQVRSLPNFKNFLKPLCSNELMQAAQQGTVIVVNIANARCDALAIISGVEPVIHIPLYNITSSRVTELRDQLKDLLYSKGVRMRGERATCRVSDETNDDACKHILAEIWNVLVKPVMDSLAFSPHPDTLPHIWWCATGPLAFLPVHAAGIYELGSINSQLGDYAISSYTPTLSTLLDSSKTKLNSSFKLLSVIQPSAPGATSIPNTEQELEYIRKRLIGREHVILKGEEGTKRQVAKKMEECNWLHLACHGVQRVNEPTNSALILQDGHLTLSEIIRLDLPNAEFAFLSACQTTTGDEKLSEEAVHIAGGMMLAGYRGVVATMWSIKDNLAPEVADKFYAHIIRDGERPESKNAAEALHASVQELRKMPGVTLTDWIPFVHLGV